MSDKEVAYILFYLLKVDKQNEFILDHVQNLELNRLRELRSSIKANDSQRIKQQFIENLEKIIEDLDATSPSKNIVEILKHLKDEFEK